MFKNKIFRLFVFLSMAVCSAFVLTNEKNGSFFWKNIFASFGVSELENAQDDVENGALGARDNERGGSDHPRNSRPEPVLPPMFIHVIDVGNADGIYISCAGKNILIDAGDYETRDSLVGYLEQQGVKNLDLSILTHPHLDHMGGMPSVLNAFGVSRFFMPEIPKKILPKGSSYMSTLSCLTKKKIPVQRPKIGEILELGPLKITFLGPCRQYDKMNNNSIVVLITHYSKKFIFMGDAEKESEYDILKSGFDLKCDFIKIGHHGSDTSTTDQFLDKVSPEYAAISTSDKYGVNFKRGKKGPPAVAKLSKRGIKTFRTNTMGNIIFCSDGKKISVKCERE
ncbi:MAG: MBL fold metallo-hydrolase [Oscillospiraceae bacterium]|jgi:beta-lactamase superfamily II metal-dependent hydrolase|nr:MBL fold metallo-hydrolase [Oscillospiraceae bacterium]